MKIDRPEKVVTEDNATVHDRAAAWADVERAQRELNRLMRMVGGAQVLALDAATLAFDQATRGPSWEQSGVRAELWRVVVEKQEILNNEAERHHAFDPEYRSLRAALAYYDSLGATPGACRRSGGSHDPARRSRLARPRRLRRVARGLAAHERRGRGPHRVDRHAPEPADPRSEPRLPPRPGAERQTPMTALRDVFSVTLTRDEALMLTAYLRVGILNMSADNLLFLGAISEDRAVAATTTLAGKMADLGERIV